MTQTQGVSFGKESIFQDGVNDIDLLLTITWKKLKKSFIDGLVSRGEFEEGV